MNKRQRQQAGYLNPSEVSRLLDMRPQSFLYHVEQGNIKRPGIKIGQRFYYGAEDVKVILKFFNNRKQWQRMPDIWEGRK